MTTTGERKQDRSELGVSVLLLVLGGLVLWDASQINTGVTQAGAVGPRAVPYLVGGLLLVCAVALAIDVLRGGHGEAEGGEDVDLRQPADWLTVLKLIGVLMVTVLTVSFLGWAISGAILFVGSAWSLGSRTLVRDVIVGLVLSVTSWYAFHEGLGVILPAGILDGVL